MQMACLGMSRQPIEALVSSPLALAFYIQLVHGRINFVQPNTYLIQPTLSQTSLSHIKTSTVKD